MNIKGEELTGTKKKIFLAALNLFSQKGFIETGIREIANAVGINESSLYSHFESKGEILDYIVEFYKSYKGHRSASERGLTTVLTKNSGTEDLLSLFINIFPEEEARYYFQAMTVMFQEAGRNSAVRKFITDHFFVIVHRRVERALRRLVEQGALRRDTDIKLWASLHISTVFAYMGRHALGVGDTSACHKGKTMMEQIKTQYDIMFELYGTKKEMV